MATTNSKENKPVFRLTNEFDSRRAPPMGMLKDIEAAREARTGQKLKPVTIDLDKIRATEIKRIDAVLANLHKNI
jgi:hypothetical protein